MRPCAEGLHNSILPRRLLVSHFSHRHSLLLLSSSPIRVSCILPDRERHASEKMARKYATIKTKKEDNVWSIDNELASKKSAEEEKRLSRRRKMEERIRRRSRHSTVMVSPSMLMEIKTVLQSQVPISKPSWDNFASSLSGIWKGAGAAFSPFTAELEPIGVGNQNEPLFDSYTLSHIEKVSSQSPVSKIYKKMKWVALNPFGKEKKHVQVSHRVTGSDKSTVNRKLMYDTCNMESSLPTYESFDLCHSEAFEEDLMSMEPGFAFFEDGAYSRGPLNIPVGEYDESKYFLSPTFIFEQCLVKGCHKRLRFVHSIEFNEGGANIQVSRVVVYEEEWAGPVNLSGGDDSPFDLKPMSQRRRIQPSGLVGVWKVLEVSATPVLSSLVAIKENDAPFVYNCLETLKKRSFCEKKLYSNDVSVLWLPDGVTGYVDVNKDGTLCIGFSWFSEEGINLVIERDYGINGNLKEVRWKTESRCNDLSP